MIKKTQANTTYNNKNKSFTFKVEWKKPEQMYKVWFHLNGVQKQAKCM